MNDMNINITPLNEDNMSAAAGRSLLATSAIHCNTNRNINIDGGVGARVMRNANDWKWAKQVSPVITDLSCAQHGHLGWR